MRITVIAAGFDRFEGEHKGARPLAGETALGLDEDEDRITGDESLSFGEDDFDVPEFLR